MFFGSTCGVCSRPGSNPCACCVEGFTSLSEADLVDVAGVIDGAVERCLVLASYGDGIGELVAELKYRGIRTGVSWISEAMAQRIGHACEHPDAVTWVPASRRGRHRRGIDQGQVLARALGQRLGVRARRLLARADGGNQTGRSRADRLAGPALAAVRPVTGTVLVIDDVLTTGASMAAAGRALHAAGATRVVALAVAHRRLIEGGPEGSTP